MQCPIISPLLEIPMKLDISEYQKKDFKKSEFIIYTYGDLLSVCFLVYLEASIDT